MRSFKLSTKALLLSAIALSTEALLALPGLAQSFDNPYPRFSDASDHWATACIEGVGEAGLMKGYLDGRFLPDGTMTRAEFAAVMIKAFPNAQTVREAPSFVDVAEDFWGSQAIRDAYERGFLAGYPDSTFKPAQPITRAQAVVVISNAQRLTLAENGPTDSQQVLRSFLRDWRQVPEWGSDAIAAAIQTGIVVNYPDANQLRPSASITRGEATALLCRTNVEGTDARYYVPAKYVTSFIDPPALTFLREFPTEFSDLLSQRFVINGQIFFAGNNGTAELWKTDGTVDGTQRVRALQMTQPNGETVQTTDASIYGTIPTEATDSEADSAAELWIVTRQAFRQSGQSESSIQAGIWHSDGTEQGTVALASLSEELSRSLRDAEYWMIEASIPVSGESVFTIRLPNSTQLWRTDGKTEAGTQRLLELPDVLPDVYRDQQSSSFGGPSNFSMIGRHLLFVTDSEEGTMLWRTDGTIEGTEQIKTIVGLVDSFKREGNQIYFRRQTVGPDEEPNEALWISDGTEAGTTAIKNFFPGSLDSDARVLATVGETVLVLANSSAGTGLWETGGTPESTRLVKQLASAPLHSGDSIFVQHDGKLFFAVPTALPPSLPASSLERQIYEPTYSLWVSDGTEAGTVQLGSPIKSFFTNFTSFNGRLFFNGNGPNGQELWVTDGTVEGTHQVIDLSPGSSPYSPNCPSQDPPPDWRRKQQSGPAQACKFYKVANSSSPRSLTVRGNFLYFIAGDRDLYRTDGTALGTQFIRRLRGEYGFYSPSITALDEQLLVTGYSDSSDRPQLWAIPEQEIPVRTGFD
ncbi:S-layer homology domain-containing protein [cf. Phormidesmis sp. LEGE 11477]|uniref:S-layer homology domain-containing protein n=1 Tax=cf. Phormidesmis sp. LEGE 11477 TaxID=1828680 RepID=UPI00187ECB0D|nr:S-layer homology domain-containing protein [cf. Phormidesmis sp. LEGE 11477]MBE9059896.1 S-layer homology domain-containing protein [cf. Phormidesmis sp. LEGE 11477]